MKTFFFFFFFGEHLRFVSLVLGLGLEHSCPWPRECLSSERLSLALALASDFFCVLGLGLGLEPCVLDSTSALRTKEKRLCSSKMPFAVNACSAVENQSSTFDSQKGGRETLAEWIKGKVAGSEKGSFTGEVVWKRSAHWEMFVPDLIGDKFEVKAGFVPKFQCPKDFDRHW